MQSMRSLAEDSKTIETEENKKQFLALDVIKIIHDTLWQAIEMVVENIDKTKSLTIRVIKIFNISIFNSAIFITKKLSEGKEIKSALEACVPELGKDIIQDVADKLISSALPKILGAVGRNFLSAFLGDILFNDELNKGEKEWVIEINKRHESAQLLKKILPFNTSIDDNFISSHRQIELLNKYKMDLIGIDDEELVEAINLLQLENEVEQNREDRQETIDSNDASSNQVLSQENLIGEIITLEENEQGLIQEIASLKNDEENLIKDIATLRDMEKSITELNKKIEEEIIKMKPNIDVAIQNAINQFNTNLPGHINDIKTHLRKCGKSFHWKSKMMLEAHYNTFNNVTIHTVIANNYSSNYSQMTSQLNELITKYNNLLAEIQEQENQLEEKENKLQIQCQTFQNQQIEFKTKYQNTYQLQQEYHPVRSSAVDVGYLGKNAVRQQLRNNASADEKRRSEVLFQLQKRGIENQRTSERLAQQRQKESEIKFKASCKALVQSYQNVGTQMAKSGGTSLTGIFKQQGSVSVYFPNTGQGAGPHWKSIQKNYR